VEINHKLWTLLGLAVTASTAQAQSSVTLFTNFDDAVAHYNNEGKGSVTQLQVGDMTGNWWGLRGQEDLGGGIKTVFFLASGFNLNNGKQAIPGQEFGKALGAWMGLTSDSWGTIRVGRQYSPANDLVTGITGDPYSPAFSTPGDADNNDGTFYVDNAIKYISPTYGGFKYELLYALGGVAGSVSSQSSSSAAVSYSAGALTVAGGYIFAKNDGPNGAGTADQTQNNSVTPLFGDVPFVGSRLISMVAVQYAFGSFIGSLRYSNAQWKPGSKFTAFNQTETFNIGGVSLNYALTRAAGLEFGYNYTKSSGASAATYNTVAAQAYYHLSKSTTLYAITAWNHASGTTFSEDGNSIVPATGSLTDIAASSSTPNQVGFILGMTTHF
jgi:predicted porin